MSTMDPQESRSQQRLLKDAESVAAEAEQLAIAILGRSSLHRDDHFGVLRRALAVRCLGYFQGAVLLCKHDLAPATAVVLRCLLEHRYVAVALATKEGPDYVVDLIRHSQSNQARYARNLQSLPSDDRHESISLEAMRELEANLNESKGETTIRRWAERAGLVSDYLTAYARLSADVHTNLLQVESHLSVGPDGLASGITGRPDKQMLPMHLVLAIDVLIDVIAALPGAWITEDDAVEANRLRARTGALWAAMPETASKS